MLQRIRDGIGPWIFGAVLGLIAISFIFWGIDFNLTGATFAAKVNGEEISLEEFDRDLQIEQNQFQELYRIELTEELRTQLRRSVVDRLVQREALLQKVGDAGYRVSDERLAEFIRSAAAFQVGGEFSMDVYENQLAVQGLSPRAFEELQREQLALLDLQVGVADSTFLTPTEYRRYIELANQQREVAYALFEVESFIEQVEIDADAVAAYYEENRDRFMTEEAAAIEYIELERADVASQIEVTEQELEDYYEGLRENFRTDEERRARHVLIMPADDESPEETEARAAQVAERIRGGEDFAAVAAEVSDDPGTAEQGGDLGWIGPGMLAGPFEDALFDMEAGEVRGPVQTDFGYHVIRLDEIRAGEEQPFAEVRDQLLEDLRTERADEIYYELANQLADSAFDAYDELAAVAMRLELPLQTLERFERSGDSEAFPNSAPIVDAVFGSEELDDGVNSPLIELTEEHVLVLRVTDRFPPEQQPLEEVESEIRETLTREHAEELAMEAAEAFRAALPDELNAAFVGAEGGGDDTASAGDSENAADAGADAGDAGPDAGLETGPPAPAAAADTDGSEAAPGDADGEAVASASGGDGDAANDADADSAGADGAADGEATAADDAAAADGDAEDDPSSESPAGVLAAMHGGRWIGPMLVGRSDAEVPTAILAQAFDAPAPEQGGVVTEPVELATGDRAVLFMTRVQQGRPDAVPREERDQLQQQLVDQVGTAELGSYAGSVRANADVTVPPDVLEPQF